MAMNTRLLPCALLLTSVVVSPQLSLAQEFPATDDCLLIAGASILTMEGAEVEAPTTAQDVLICGQQIRAIGDVGSLEVPPETTRIDGAGKVLMPGLTDGHVHLNAPLDLELNLAWGVTSVRNLFGNPLSLNLRERVRTGELWGPRMWTAGPIIDGDPALWPGSAAVATADAARSAVKDQAEAGYDFIKVYSLLRPEPFFAALEAAQEAGLKVGGHVPLSVPLADAVEAGMDFIEHLQEFLPAMQAADSELQTMSKADRRKLGFSDRARLSAEGFDPKRLPEVAQLMVKHKVWNIPTFLVLERISASAQQKSEWFETHPQMRTQGQMTENFWNPANDFRLQNVTEEQLLARQRSARLHMPIVKALHDAGAELMLGTDTPNPFVFPGYSVHEELRRFVEAGLSPWQALRTATVQPARFLGQEAVFGQVKAGLEADLLLLDADPLQDIANTERIFGVITRGRWLDRATLTAKVNAVAKAYGKE